MAVKIGKLEATLEEILRRLDQMAEARNRDKESDTDVANRLRATEEKVARLEERNNFIMKVFYSALGIGGPGLGGAGVAIGHFVTSRGGG